MELQWRGGATEPDPFSSGRLPSANAGGWWWTVSPAASVELASGMTALVGTRIPIVSDVTGNQLVAGIGGFAALSYTGRRVPSRPRPVGPTIDVSPGGITVVDYWATWCAPCIEIGQALDGARARWPDVKIVRVNATRWPADDAPALPAGAGGLPVIEIFDETRRVLLLGAEAMQVVDRVDALRAARASSPSSKESR
jgi:thiol-disulfide isomerase/thioredoxin